MLGNVRFLFGAIGLAIVISIFFITANTMAMAARERTTEVAVLRTLGFRRSRVVTVVIAEALLVGVAGAVLGVVLGILLLQGVGAALQQMSIFVGDLAPEPSTLLLGLAVGLAIGALSGAGPAVIAARLPIVDGLRRVG
jgi:putative ABC transport system permease protein